MNTEKNKGANFGKLKQSEIKEEFQRGQGIEEYSNHCKRLKLEYTHPRKASSDLREQFDHVAADTPPGRVADMI